MSRRAGRNTIAVFADVKGSGRSHWWGFPIVEELLHERFGGEDRSLYRFLFQISHHLDIDIERLEDSDGRSIWAVMFEKRMIVRLMPGGLYAPCSERLKRLRILSWLEENFEPGTYTIVLAMSWDEGHRIDAAQAFWDCPVWCPLTERPYVDNCHIIDYLTAAGIDIPALYLEGFHHNNCNGGCVKAGQAHFANLCRKRPLVYAYWEQQEAAPSRYLGKKVTILTDRRGGETTPMSLAEFRVRIKRGEYDRYDWGGCGCYAPRQLKMLDIVAQDALLNGKHSHRSRKTKHLAENGVGPQAQEKVYFNLARQ